MFVTVLWMTKAIFCTESIIRWLAWLPLIGIPAPTISSKSLALTKLQIRGRRNPYIAKGTIFTENL